MFFSPSRATSESGCYPQQRKPGGHLASPFHPPRRPGFDPEAIRGHARLAEIAKGVSYPGGAGGGCSLPAFPFSNPKGQQQKSAALHAALENVGTCAHVDLSVFAGAAVLGRGLLGVGGRMVGHGVRREPERKPTSSRLVKGSLAKSAWEWAPSLFGRLPGGGNGAGRVYSNLGEAVISRIGGEERLASE